MLGKFCTRTIASCLLAAAAFGIVPSANATSGTNTLQDVTIESGTSFARIALNGTAITGRPTCHNASYTVHYGFDISTEKGKALLSLATAAMLSGKRVAANGTGACTNLGSVTIETLGSLIFFNN